MIEMNLSGYSVRGEVSGAQTLEANVIPRGNDGVSPEVEITEVEGGHKISITDRTGTKEAVIKDGRGIELFWQSKKSTLPGDTNEWTIRYTDGTESVIAVQNAEDGKDGKSVYVESIAESDEDGGENIVQFTGAMPDDPNTRLVVRNGRTGGRGEPGYTPQKGVDYFDGKDGKDGKNGQDGYTPQKGVDYFDGQDGKDGKDGKTPVKGVDYFDGEDGKDGTDGFSPIVGVSKEGKVTTLTLTDKDGVKSATINDGADGKTPVKGVDYFDGAPGYTPQKGIDYVDGEDGEACTVKSVTESNEDGGENVVTFSDGKTLTVKNGKEGKQGERGLQGQSGVVAPVSGFFTLTVDENGDLYALTAEGSEAPAFEYDETTGNLYFITEGE